MDDFSKLLSDITENPELVLTSQLTDEQILELQKRINPYSYVPNADPRNPHKKVAVVSYTNLREDYLRKFAMTSLVGFIYKAASEYEVPAEDRRWKPKKAGTDTSLLDMEKTIGRLEDILALAKKSLTTDTVEEHNDHIFGVTTMLYLLGEDAKHRIPATLEKTKKLPMTNELLQEYSQEIKKLTEVSNIEAPADTGKKIISNFIDTLFKYDPNRHVKSAKSVDELDESKNDLVDPERVTLDRLQLAATKKLKSVNTTTSDMLDTIFASQVNYNAASVVLGNKSLYQAVDYMMKRPDVYEKHLKDHINKDVKTIIDIIPPQDTYHKWSYYTEVNYEDIRKATEAIYADKPDLDWAISLLETFEGTQERINEQFDAYKMRYQDEMLTDIKMIQYGGWTLLGDFKKNRSNIDFYNKNMGILKKIIDRHAEDKKVGTELMKNRVKVSKAKNIAECGPDVPSLKNYKVDGGDNLESFGAQKVISTEEMKRIEAAKGNLKIAQELEYIDNLRKSIKELEEAKHELSDYEKDTLEMNKKQLVRAVELLEVPDDAIQVDVWTNDGSDLKKTSFYTKSDEALDAETKEEVKEDPKPNSSGLVTKKVELNGQTVDVDNIAPFARAFYAKAEGGEDISQMEYIETESGDGKLISK